MVYDDFGLQTVFVMDPELVHTKSPLYDDVLGRAGGKGLLIAEGDDWRRQRRIVAPLFRAEAILSAATKMGGILTGAADNEAAKLETAGVDLGFSYQFLDDVADVVAGVAEVGKERGYGCRHAHRRRSVWRRRCEAEGSGISGSKVGPA